MRGRTQPPAGEGTTAVRSAAGVRTSPAAGRAVRREPRRPGGDRLPIYLDHHATTPVDPRVVRVVVEAMTNKFGNANSSDHRHGEAAADILRVARNDVATLVQAEPDDVRFTSGASEALGLALAYASEQASDGQLTVATSRAEHLALLDAIDLAALEGWVEPSWLEVDSEGRVRLDSVDRALNRGAALICVMAANNEVGTINDVKEVALRSRRYGAHVLVDATQAAGRIPLRFEDWGLDYLVMSSHKIHGPKGAGALVCRDGSRLPPPAHHPKHGGTPNTAAIAGLGLACRICHEERAAESRRIEALRDRMQALLTATISGLAVNGDQAARLPNNLHVSVPDVPNDVVIAHLRDEVSISTGAACASGADAPSHVLRAMGLPSWRQEGALRISLGRFTTAEEVDAAAKAIAAAARAAREAVGARP